MKTHWPLPLIIQLSCKKRYEGVVQTLKSSDHCLVFCFITPKMRVIIPSKVCWKKEVMSWIYPICLRTWHLVSISSFLMLSKVAFNGSFRTLILCFTFRGKIFTINSRAKSPDWILLSHSLLLSQLLDQLLWPGWWGGGELFYSVSQSSPPTNWGWSQILACNPGWGFAGVVSEK